MIRVMVADDHVLIREGLKRLFEMDSRLQVVKEAANGREALEAARQGGIDVVLTDLSMPDVNGMELIMHIHSLKPALPIIVLSMHNDVQTVRRALKAGASGYVVKDTDPEILLAAVDQVAKGGRFIDPNVAERMLFDIELPQRESPHEVLSDREFNIMCMLAMGQSMNQIATKLAISNKTVSTYKARLMAKLELSSDVELIRYAMSHGLADQ